MGKIKSASLRSTTKYAGNDEIPMTNVERIPKPECRNIVSGTVNKPMESFGFRHSLACISRNIFNHGVAETRRKEVIVKTLLFSENRLPKFSFVIGFFSAFLKFSSPCLRGEKSGLVVQISSFDIPDIEYN